MASATGFGASKADRSESTSESGRTPSLPEPGTLRSGARRVEYPATPEQEDGDVELDSSTHHDLIRNHPMRQSTTSLGMSRLPDGEHATSIQAYEHSVTPSLMPMLGTLPDSDTELSLRVKNDPPPTVPKPSDHHSLPDTVGTDHTVGASEINTLLKVISAQQKQIDKLLDLHAGNATCTEPPAGYQSTDATVKRYGSVADSDDCVTTVTDNDQECVFDDKLSQQGDALSDKLSMRDDGYDKHNVDCDTHSDRDKLIRATKPANNSKRAVMPRRSETSAAATSTRRPPVHKNVMNSENTENYNVHMSTPVSHVDDYDADTDAQGDNVSDFSGRSMRSKLTTNSVRSHSHSVQSHSLSVRSHSHTHSAHANDKCMMELKAENKRLLQLLSKRTSIDCV